MISVRELDQTTTVVGFSSRSASSSARLAAPVFRSMYHHTHAVNVLSTVKHAATLNPAPWYRGACLVG